MSFDEAKAFQSDHGAELQDVIGMVDACRPIEAAGGYPARVFASDLHGQPKCSLSKKPYAPHLPSALKGLGVLSVSYTLAKSGEQPGKLEEVSFELYGQGLSTSARRSSLFSTKSLSQALHAGRISNTRTGAAVSSRRR